MRTIFDHRRAPQHKWVRCRVVLGPNNVKHLSLRLTQPESENGFSGSYEITDFRAPDHPEIDWAWLDQHKREVWLSVEFTG